MFAVQLGDIQFPLRKWPTPDPRLSGNDRIVVCNKTGFHEFVPAGQLWNADFMVLGGRPLPSDRNGFLGWCWATEPTPLAWESTHFEFPEAVRWHTISAPGAPVYEINRAVIGNTTLHYAFTLTGPEYDAEENGMRAMSCNYLSLEDAQRAAAALARDIRTRRV